MTVYNFAQTNFYIDEDGISAFTGDDTGEIVIIADDDSLPPPPFPYFGFLILMRYV